MATALPNTTRTLKLVTRAEGGTNVESSPESATAGVFWTIAFITLGLSSTPSGSIDLHVDFGGTTVWRQFVPNGIVVPYHIDFGAGLYTGVKNEDFLVHAVFAGGGVSLSYGYF